MKAFPQSEATMHIDLPIETQQGMDLRDYFAAKAMPALIIAEIEASKRFYEERGWEWFDIDMDKSSVKDLAQRSYDLADLMMEARKND